MSFSIDLMQNLSPREVVDKNVSVMQTLTGVLRNETSIIEPTIVIEGNVSDLANCNYMYISKFNRYYYITDIKSVRNDIIEISAHVDVLMTYKEAIRQNSAIIRRQESDWNLYLNDGSFKVYQNPMVLTKAFPSGFTRQELVLAVAGS